MPGDFSKEVGLKLSGLLKVDIRLDIGALLESMVEQARLVVFKAVARATSAADVALLSVKAGQSTQLMRPNVSSQSLSGFSSALNLTTAVTSKSPRLQKAQESAVRLNSVLQGTKSDVPTMEGNSLFGKVRKSRSIQWDHHLVRGISSDFSSPRKKPRLIPTGDRLRSFKSFGRPHGGDGQTSGPRNATFAAFGRPGEPTWGRDGRLRNHPTPGATHMSTFDTTVVEKTKHNASFDLMAAGNTSQAASGSTLLGASMRQSGSVQSSLPRTATALESWLVKNATSWQSER